jgi:hypothetical protein
MLGHWGTSVTRQAGMLEGRREPRSAIAESRTAGGRCPASPSLPGWPLFVSASLRYSWTGSLGILVSHDHVARRYLQMPPWG